MTPPTHPKRGCVVWGFCVLSEHRQWPFRVFSKQDESPGGGPFCSIAHSLRVSFHFAPDSRLENSCGAERKRNEGSKGGLFHSPSPPGSRLSASAFFPFSYLASEAVKSSLFFGAQLRWLQRGGLGFPTSETRQQKGVSAVRARPPSSLCHSASSRGPSRPSLFIVFSRPLL